MDNIHYPRQLNRPTYLVWKWTHHDFTIGFGMLLALIIPGMFVKAIPQEPAVFAAATFMIYRAVIVSTKPRGYDTHIIWSWFQPKQANPGHTHRRIFVVPAIQSRKLGRFSKLIGSIGGTNKSKVP